MATVLICDDEAPMRQLISAALDVSGHGVVEAADGRTALRLARLHGADVVILDVMLPDQSGLDVLAGIRADQRLASIGVIVLTASAQRVGAEAAYAAGADVFMAKPFRPSALVDEVERLLARA